MVPTNLVHIAVGPGGGTWDRKKMEIIGNRKIQHSKKCCDGAIVFFLNTKTKLTALARSIDSEKDWTDLLKKISKSWDWTKKSVLSLRPFEQSVCNKDNLLC